jgi:hypothetical protein
MLTMLMVPLALMGSAFAQQDKFCLWQHKAWAPSTEGSGESQCFDPGNHNIKSELNNRVSALRNRTRTTLCAFDGAGQQGPQLPVGSGSHFADLSKDTAPDGRSWDNRISSIGYCK